jgi:hypothetical protein
MRAYLKEIFLAAMLSAPLPAQTPGLARVFVDCGACGGDYLRQSLTFVNLVRDRGVADVGVMVTALPTASGGEAYSVEVLGLVDERRIGDTVVVNIPPDATESMRRVAIVRALKLALVPHVRSTPARQYLDVTYSPPATTQAATRGERDPWRQWVFRVGGSGSFAADENYSAAGGDGRFSASRVTEAIRLELSARGSYNRERFRLEDSASLTSHRRSWSTTALLVHSLGDQLSFGLTSSAGSSIFENTKFQFRAMPAFEYDLFPYKQATQRQVVVRYAAGVRSTRYVDTTIYNRIAESRPLHELSAVSDVKQPWGSVWGSAVWSQYLHDRSKQRTSIEAGIDWRIRAGLSLNTSANVSRIRDQLNIRGGNLSDQDRLLRLRELQSGYSMSAGVGLSYTFGSVFSNVVNPRFRL